MYENVSCRGPVGIIFGCPSILEWLAAVLPGFYLLSIHLLAQTN